MNDPESLNARPGFVPEEADLRMQFEGLRRLFLAALVAMLVLGVSLNVFLLRQTAFVRKDLQTVRPQIQQAVAIFEKSEEPEIKNFVNALIEFSRTHPDFRPVLAKYNITTNAPAAPASFPAAPKK